MQDKIVKLIKSDNVSVMENVCLVPAFLAGKADSLSAAGSSAGRAVQQAGIVESNPEYAVIEVICSCGCKTHIQCNYADVAGSGVHGDS